MEPPLLHAMAEEDEREEEDEVQTAATAGGLALPSTLCVRVLESGTECEC